MGIKTKKYNLPINYDELEPHQKRAVRLQYIKEQEGVCQHCNMPIYQAPDNEVQLAYIHWDLFPEGFRENPVHLHHDHGTGMTIGAVHMKCNAYLWQYKGE